MLFSLCSYMCVSNNYNNCHSHESAANLEGMCLHTKNSNMYLLLCTARSTCFHRRRYLVQKIKITTHLCLIFRRYAFCLRFNARLWSYPWCTVLMLESNVWPFSKRHSSVYFLVHARLPTVKVTDETPLSSKYKRRLISQSRKEEDVLGAAGTKMSLLLSTALHKLVQYPRINQRYPINSTRSLLQLLRGVQVSSAAIRASRVSLGYTPQFWQVIRICVHQNWY